jgi:hypothetical protein
MAYLLIRKALTAMRTELDPHEVGGAPLLGVNGVAIIAHGASNPRAIRNAIRAASNEALVHQVNAEIIDILAKSESVLGAKPAGKGIRGIFAKMRDRLSRPKEAGDREEREIRKDVLEPPRKEPIKVEVLPASERFPERLPTPAVNGAKSTGDLVLQNGDKPAIESALHEIDDKNPHKEPHS